MRHIMLGAVCLLAVSLAAPAAAGEWIKDSRTGCAVWNPNPQPNETITWSA